MTGTISGTVGPLNNVTFGGFSSQVFTDGVFGIMGFSDGAQDLVAFSSDGDGATRMLILRDQAVANGGDIGTIDLTADGFDPGTASITVGGLVGGETGTITSQYATSSAGTVCGLAPLEAGLLASPFILSSAPPAEQASDEFHVATIGVVSGSAVKSVSEAFATLADRTVTVPADVPAPTLTDVTGSAGYLRIQAEYTLPAEYNGATFFDYALDTYNMTVYASAEVQSMNVSLAMPDFTGLTGWDDAWGIPTAATGVDYVVTATGATAGSAPPFCTDGGRTISGTIAGNYN
jgi:hypothetical protein